MISLMQVVDGFINVPYPTAVAAHIPTDSSIFIKNVVASGLATGCLMTASMMMNVVYFVR